MPNLQQPGPNGNMQNITNNWSALNSLGPWQPLPVTPGDNNGTGPGQSNDQYDSRIGNGGLPQGIYGAANRAYVSNVQPNELATTHLENIVGQNSALMRNAELRGREWANSRGSLTGSGAVGAAQRAVLEAATPLAMDNAGAYRSTRQQNVDVLNAKVLADLNARTGIQSSLIGADASAASDRNRLQMQREDLAYRGEQSQLDRNYNQAMNYWNRYYDNQFGNQEYAFRAGVDQRTVRNNFFTGLMNMSMVDPETFTPERIAGVMNAYLPVWDSFSQDIDALWGGSDLYG